MWEIVRWWEIRRIPYNLFSVAFAITANVCYTAGWIVDLVLHRGEPNRKLFRVGLIFSTVLALLPGLWAICAWLITVYTGKKLD
jgi:hypothetical protein